MSREDYGWLLPEARALLRSAARESLHRIVHDGKDASPRVQGLLEYLEAHLFDKGLTVNRLKEACGVRDNSVVLRFHAETGQAPKAYIAARRLETAATLLEESDLRIWQISELTGYSSLAVFGKAFARWAGQRPSVYRKKTREVTTAVDDFDPPIDDALLQKALAGALAHGQARALIQRLLDLYRPKNQPPDEPRDGRRRRR